MKRCMTCREMLPRERFETPQAKSCAVCRESGRAKWTKAKQSAYRYRADRIRILEQNRAWKEANALRYRSQRREYTAQKRAEKRRIVLDHYGGGCACACGCGETEPLFLTIDHINGNGNAHRREIGKTDMWIWLHANGFPDGFRILCYNCNAGRYRNGGDCPKERTGQMEEPDRGGRRGVAGAAFGSPPELANPHAVSAGGDGRGLG